MEELKNKSENDVKAEIVQNMSMDQSEPTGTNENDMKTKTVEETTTNQSEPIDPYAYTKTDAFTSEVFKVEIQNLPKFFGIKQLKKKLGQVGVKPCKVKMPERSSYAFVNFRCEEEREEALKAITGQVWKHNTVTAKKARPSADPALLKRKQQAENEVSGPRGKKCKQEEDTRTPEERLRDAVTPLWRLDYQEQLKQKETSVREYLVSLSRLTEKQNPSLRKRHAQQRKLHDSCCKLVPIKHSPVLKNYRNKCEFTIGQTVDGADKAIGFRLGSYKGGNVHVASPSGCDLAPPHMIKAAQLLEEYCQERSDLPGFDPVLKAGAWRQLTVRSSLQGGVMVILVLYKEGLTQDVIENERRKLAEFIECKDVLGMFTKVAVYLEVTGDDRQSDLHHLGGETHLYESLLGLTFRISPQAFFQVNTPGAEVLYSTVGQWADLTENTVLLDVCCGTGTIGLTLAQRVKKVIGIEMCKEAIEDAKYNAQINNLQNVEFHCGKAEDVLPRLLRQYKEEGDVVAVVDPPRGGLHADVVIALRGCSFVKRLVYVSCSPNGAKNNIVDLTRTPSRRVGGTEFRLVQSVPVDLFPLTPHYELVMLFCRKGAEPRGEGESETSTQKAGESETSAQKAGESETGAQREGESETSAQTAGDTESGTQKAGESETSAQTAGETESETDAQKPEEGVETETAHDLD